MKYYMFASPVLMWFICALGIFVAFQIFPYASFFEPMVVTYAIGGLGIVCWFYLFTKGVSSNIQAPQRPHHIKKIVTEGIYARVRHPIYAADVALAWSIFLMLPTQRILISVIWVTVVLVAWAYLEERALRDLFGEEYERYASHTPMFLPSLRAPAHSEKKHLP